MRLANWQTILSKQINHRYALEVCGSPQDNEEEAEAEEESQH